MRRDIRNVLIAKELPAAGGMGDNKGMSQGPKPHPMPLVPPQSVASPGQLGMARQEPPWWRPTWGDVARQLGWRWLLALPLGLMVVFMLVLPLIPGAFNVLWILGLKGLGLVAAIPIALAGWAIRGLVQARQEPFCIHCGYDLSGLGDHHTCPECGRPYSLDLIAEYRRDPHWFIQRYRKQHQMPKPDTPFTAGEIRRKKSRDGTG